MKLYSAAHATFTLIHQPMEVFCAIFCNLHCILYLMIILIFLVFHGGSLSSALEALGIPFSELLRLFTILDCFYPVLSLADKF